MYKIVFGSVSEYVLARSQCPATFGEEFTNWDSANLSVECTDLGLALAENIVGRRLV